MKIETGNNFFPRFRRVQSFETRRKRESFESDYVMYRVLPRWWRSHFSNERAYFETMDQNDQRTTIRVNLVFIQFYNKGEGKCINESREMKRDIFNG